MANLADTIIHLGQLALAFGRVDRITYHEDGKTFESDTDHTVMLGLTACALAARQPGLDVGLVAEFALVHDFVEVYAGDTPTLHVLNGSERADKAVREHAAYQRIAAEFGDLLPWLPERIAQYERRDTDEARFVKALDKLLPKITHLSNNFRTLREQGMSHADMVERYGLQEQELRSYAGDFPVLMDLRTELVGRVLRRYVVEAVA